MLITIIKTSTLFRLLKDLGKIYSYFEGCILKIYRDSQVNKIILGVQSKTKLFFRYSILGKISEIREKENIDILIESKTIDYLINLYRRCKSAIALFFKKSLINNLAEVLKKEFYSYPVKNTSLIIVTAILTNTVFSFLLKKEIGLLSWIIKGLLLFVGVTGLASDADWSTMRSNSIFFNLLFKKNK